MNDESDGVQSAGIVDKVNLLRAIFNNIPRQRERVESLFRNLGFADKVDS